MKLTNNELKHIYNILERNCYEYSDLINDLTEDINRNPKAVNVNNLKQELKQAKNADKLSDRLNDKIVKELIKRNAFN